MRLLREKNKLRLNTTSHSKKGPVVFLYSSLGGDPNISLQDAGLSVLFFMPEGLNYAETPVEKTDLGDTHAN